MSNFAARTHTNEILKINISIQNYYFIGSFCKHITTEFFTECPQISKFSLMDIFIINLH